MSFDHPDPEWKRLSGFAVSKGKKKRGKLPVLLIILKGVLMTLLLPIASRATLGPSIDSGRHDPRAGYGSTLCR